MEMVSVYEAKTHLSRLLERVANGERIIISKSGKPVADLVIHQATQVRIGGLRGKLRYDDDDLEQPDPEIIEMFYGSDAAPR